jgi:hypothetical protein
MKRFFRKIVAFLASLFTNVNEWIYDHVQPSIEMVQRIKKAVESPYANLITTLIPGSWDNMLQDAAIKLLTKAIDNLRITEDIFLDGDWTSKVAKLTKYLRSSSKPMRAAIYHQLAVELAKQSAFAKQLKEAEEKGLSTDQVNTDVKGHSISLLTQMQYSKLKENVQATDLPEVDPYLQAKIDNTNDHYNKTVERYKELYPDADPTEILSLEELNKRIELAEN